VTVEDRAEMPNLRSYVPQLVTRRLRPATDGTDEPRATSLPAAMLLIDITGFTAVTANAVRQGPAGAEHLSRSLNTYLGRIIDLVAAHGGEVAKIVGDALIPIWAGDEEDPVAAVHRAAVCGLATAGELEELEIEEGRRLSVKVGLCAGEVSLSRVGGVDGKWLFVVSGDAVGQLAGVADRMLTGALVASPAAISRLGGDVVVDRIDGGYARIRAPLQLGDLRSIPAPGLAGAEQDLRAYIPDVSLARIDAGQSDWLAELRRTTVIFVNVPSSSGAPGPSLDVLQAVASAIQLAARTHGGWVKEITVDEKGTTVVVAFGVAPFSHEDDPARAVRAAMAIHSELADTGLSAGIGVATGDAFCGPVGNLVRRDFVLLGQHVNVAARLMRASTDDVILCDAATYEAAGGGATFERLPSHVLKGLGAPVAVFRVTEGGAPARQPAALVNRSAEVHTADQALRALTTGDGGMLILEGEPGIGKSRLAAEIVARAEIAEVRTLRGAAAEVEATTPYNAWRGIFERLLGLEGVRDQTQRAQVIHDWLGEERAGLAPVLDLVLSLDAPDNDTTIQLTGAVRAENTRDLLIELLGHEASRGPTLILLEDAHWLDSASWTLLDRVRRDLATILVLVTMRPVADATTDPAASMRPHATIIPVGPLGASEVQMLACQRTGADRLADDVEDVIRQRAGGNPLFIEQLTFAMRDAGRIVVDNGVCRAATVGGLDVSIIPDTVQRVITTRVDQLPPAEAMTLKVASVIGQRFSLDTLHEIHPVPTERDALRGHLATLERLHLIVPDQASPSTYEFGHVIAQEVAYNLMLSQQSRELHRRLAEGLERLHAADLSPFHPILAHHWRRAGSPERAVDHLELAGKQALRTFANEEATEFLEEASSVERDAKLNADPSRRARWELQLGEAHVNMSRYHEGRRHLEAGLRLMGQPAPTGRVGQPIAVLRELVRQIGHRAGIRSRRGPSDREELIAVCRAFSALAEASYYDSETLLPLYCVIRTLNDAEAAESDGEIAGGLAGTGALLGLIPLAGIAEWYLRRALDRLDRVEDLPTHEFVEITVGFYYIGAARWEPARERFRSVRRTARRLGDRRRLDDALANEMELEYLQGNVRTSLERSNELVASASARADRRYEAEGLAGRAYCAWLFGSTREAFDDLERIRAIMLEGVELTDELRLQYHGLAAMMHASPGDEAQALAAADEALRLTADARPAFYGTFLGYLGPADVHLQLWERGSHLQDHERTIEALRRFKAFASVFPMARPRRMLLEGRLAWLRGNHAKALQSMRAGLATAERLDMPYEAALAHTELGRRLEASNPERTSHLQSAQDLLGRIGVPVPPMDSPP
jgi:class 3 adenylate cyclase/tetratricopeptide (TPR) repeat protein